MNENVKASDQDGPVYTVVPREYQQAAMVFLNEQLLQTPTWLHDEAILRRIEHAGAVDRIRQIQVSRLNQLLDPGRMQRLIEAEVFHPSNAYTLLAFMTDLRTGVWSELSGNGAIDIYRRNLQRGYLDRMAWLMTAEYTVPQSTFLWRTPVDVGQSDIRPFVRGELTELKGQLARRLQRTRDRATRYHLQDAVARIDVILEDKNGG